MRRGFWFLGIAVLLAALAAGVARADVTTDTTATTTTDTATTATTTTTVATTTSTTQTTTTSKTTTTAPGTSTTPRPTSVGLVPFRLSSGCVGAGLAAIAEPQRAVVALTRPNARPGPSAYPASRPFLTFASAALTGAGCRGSHAALRNLSLFGGAVTVARIRSTGGTGTVSGLRVGGSAVRLKRGQTVAIGRWGLLTLGATSGRLSAPLVLRLVHQHESLPAQTAIFIGFAAQPQSSAITPSHATGPHHHHARKSSVPQPLAVTPRLGIRPSHYVFPIDGGASYADTYGANRNDIYDGWHHGDDLFAPLGTPVVAVVTGKLTLVGWNALGGWRLWVTDKKGNSFYYAHLAGYSLYILHHRRVKAGQVIGFLGRTGDAFTTTPHVHFEIHPHQFLKLGYDGAVDPTPYLRAWRVENLGPASIPAAARLRAPAGTPSQQAATVWGELLKARDLMPDGEPAVAWAHPLRRPFPATQTTPAFVDARRLASSRRIDDAASRQASPWPAITLGLALALLATLGSLLVVRRRQSS